MKTNWNPKQPVSVQKVRVFSVFFNRVDTMIFVPKIIILPLNIQEIDNDSVSVNIIHYLPEN